MNFDRTDEQVALQDVLQRFCDDRFPVPEVRRWGEPGHFDRDRWAQLAGLGVFELANATDGTGSRVDAVLAFEVLGRALVPGPLIAAALAAGAVDGVGSGERVPTLVDLRDAPALAHHLAHADVVVGFADGGLWQVDPAAVRGVQSEALDPTTMVWVVEHLPNGLTIGDGSVAARWQADGDLLVAALLIGVATAAMERAVEHAKQRHQFDRPIGSFQAVQHLLADCFARSELARASLYAAAATADDPACGDPIRATAGARYLATQAATRNAKTALHVFGGMGFTWEADPHLFVKRAWTLQSTLGSSTASLDTLARQLA